MNGIPVSPAPTGKWATILWLTVANALVFALHFVLRAGYILFVRQSIPSVSRDVLWMAPLGHLMLFALAAIPVVALARFVSRERVQAGALAWFVTVGVFGILLPWTEIHRAAALLLSIGAGVTASRVFSGEPARLLRRARAVAVVLATGFAIAAAVTGAWRAISLRRAIASLPGAPEGAPNVLLIILDTVRASELSLYGYERQTTPNLDGFAAGGVTFDQAMATAPWTLASHATMFTGRYPQWLSVTLTTPLDRRDPTLAEVLSARGYTTTGIAANIFYTSWESGLARGFLHYHDYRVNFLQVARASLWGQSRFAKDLMDARNTGAFTRALTRLELVTLPKPAAKLEMPSAAEITDKFLAFHESRDRAHPYFAFLNFIDAHKPYDPPPEFRRRFAKSPKNLDVYDGEIAYIDSQLGRIFRQLEQSRELGNTLVIVTADHGEHQGDHGLQGHGNSLYTQLIRVPLVFRFDGHVPRDLRVPNVVSLRDLPSSVLDIIGPEPTPTFPGTTLARFWSDASDSGSAAVAQLGKTRMDDLTRPALDPAFPKLDSAQVAFFDDSMHLIRRTTNALEEAYRYRSDSLEERNVGSTEPAAVAVLREKLRVALQADGPPVRGAGASACRRGDRRLSC